MRHRWTVWITVTIVAALMAGLLIYLDRRNQDMNDATQTSYVTCSTQTIQKLLTASGQIVTGQTETLAISTSKRFLTACVEVGDKVAAGTKLCRYKDGTYLTAPFDGVITAASFPLTGAKATSANYITVSSTASLMMTVAVSEADYAQVALGQTVYIVPNGDESKTYQGTITYLSGSASTSGSVSYFTAKVTLDNDGYLKIGMSAVATIVLQQAADVVTVPITAVNQDDEGSYVMVQSGGSAVKTYIQTGLSDADSVEVSSGLTGNETVVVQTIAK